MNHQTKHSDIMLLTNAQKIRRACSVIIPLCFLSLFISLFIASSANDVYAFVKPEKTASLELFEGEGVYEVAKQLEELGIIEKPALFCLYVRTKHAEDKVICAEGSLSFDASMSYREILKVFAKNQKTE